MKGVFKNMLLFAVFIFATTAAYTKDKSVKIADSKKNIDSAESDGGETVTNALLLQSSSTINNLLKSKSATKAILAYTKGFRPIELFYFPGTSHKNALVIAGVHGSELSSIEVARQLIKNLSAGEKPYYNTIVVPCLFPDNAAIADSFKTEIGSLKNIGRYTNNKAADPNRQMPAAGNAFAETDAHDFAGREIETENQLLLQLIQTYKPERIANLHSIRNTNCAGIYADPRTDCNSMAQGFFTDSTLAIQMAWHIKNQQGFVPGNKLTKTPTALYYCDPVIAKEGAPQTRNIHGSQLSGNRGYGVSLGTWASTAVCDKNADKQRDSITLLTIEFPGNKRPQDYATKAQQTECRQNIKAYAMALEKVFVQDNANNIFAVN